ncbi:recombinase family protein [Sphingomonas sp. LHG3443-2]|uniref:recombinase family protein n=1 Tax=Sphingomonas sp. LHG3443-2 TaxID=2804639 RepID=UPI003CF7E53B
MTGKPRAIGYGRFSDEKQSPTSTADQGRNIAAYASEKGMELIAYLSDDAITGATMARPGLQAMIRAVDAGEVDVVIIEDVDRLGRDEEYLQFLKKLYARRDVVLHTLVGGGPIDDLLFSFKGIISEAHRKKIAYWSRRGLVGKAERGGFTGGRTLGYEREVSSTLPNGVVEDRIIIDPEGADLVRTIFQMYADGLSLKQICVHLDGLGVPSPGAAMKRKKSSIGWNPSTLSGNIERGEGSSTTASTSASASSTAAVMLRSRTAKEASNAARETTTAVSGGSL